MTNDQSISRTHSLLYPIAGGQLFAVDYNSKYGIYINDDAIQTNQRVAQAERIELRPGDIIRFGLCQNIWRVEHVQFTIVTSTITEIRTKEEIEAATNLLDGRFQQQWDDTCTHLVMGGVTITIKALVALIRGIPIVTPEFLKQTILAVREKRPAMPEPKDFIPQVTEEYILNEKSCYAVNLDRCRLFDGKIFVFMLNKHQQQFKEVIELARGKCFNLATDKLKKSFLLKKDVIVVDYVPSAESQSQRDIADVAEFLVKNGRRMISDSEIGLAIIHVSLAQFCNPDHRFEQNFVVGESEKSPGNLLTNETPQSDTSPAKVVCTIEIPETIDLVGNNHEEMETNADDGHASFETRSTRRTTRSSQGAALPSAKPLFAVPEGVSKRKAEKISPTGPAKRTKVAEKSPTTRRSSRLPIQNEVEPQIDKSNAPLTNNPCDSPSTKASTSKQNQPRQEGPIPSTSTAPSPPPLASNEPISSPANHSVLSSSNIFGVASQSLSGFLCTQNLAARANSTMKENPNTSENNGKRPLEDSDDENEGNLFAFRVKPMNKKKKTGGQASSSESLFGFGDMSMSTMRASQRSRTKPSDTPKVTQNESLVNQQEATIAAKLEHIKPLPFSDVWLGKEFCKGLKLDDDADSTRVKIKDEPLEEHEMTRAEINRRWEQSLLGKIEVRTLHSSFIKRTIDVVDRGVSMDTTATTAVRQKNFKAFVKVIENGIV